MSNIVDVEHFMNVIDTYLDFKLTERFDNKRDVGEEESLVVLNSLFIEAGYEIMDRRDEA